MVAAAAIASQKRRAMFPCASLMVAVLAAAAPQASPAVAAKPLFRDPVHDGAADPVVVWNPHRGAWWMFYTNRRANIPRRSGVAWVHGTRIGIAESKDAGATWSYAGTADIELPEELGGPSRPCRGTGGRGRLRATPQRAPGGGAAGERRAPRL